MKIIKINSCSECPNFVRGPSHTLLSGGCNARLIWFEIGVDTSKIHDTCRLEDASTCLSEPVRNHTEQVKAAIAIVRDQAYSFNHQPGGTLDHFLTNIELRVAGERTERNCDEKQ